MKYKIFPVVVASVIATTVLTSATDVSAWTVKAEEGSASYTITREISDVYSNVTNTFTYTITPKDTSATGAPTSATIEFSDATPIDGKVTATSTIDFSDIIFSATGNYGYTITETASSDVDNYPLSTNSYTAWLSVRNEVDETTGVPTGNHAVTFSGFTINDGSSDDGSKVENESGSVATGVTFTASAVRTYTTVKLTTTGNSADANECFDLDITYDDSVSTTYTLTTESTCADNPSTVAANGTTTIHLKHNDIATIGIMETSESNAIVYEIPLGVEFSLVEQGATDYTTYIDGKESETKTSATKITVAIDDDDFDVQNTISVVNEKEITPRTGVVLSVLPFVLITMIGVAGAIYVAKTKKSNANR